MNDEQLTPILGAILVGGRLFACRPRSSQALPPRALCQRGRAWPDAWTHARRFPFYLHRSGQIDLYTTIISQPSFGRVVQKLNGRRLVEIIVALLELWIEGEAILEGDP